MKLSAWQVLGLCSGLLWGNGAIAIAQEEHVPPLPSAVFSESTHEEESVPASLVDVSATPRESTSLSAPQGPDSQVDSDSTRLAEPQVTQRSETRLTVPVPARSSSTHEPAASTPIEPQTTTSSAATAPAPQETPTTSKLKPTSATTESREGVRPWKPRSTPARNYGTKASPKVRATVTSRVTPESERAASLKKAERGIQPQKPDKGEETIRYGVAPRARGTHARTSVRGMENVAKVQPHQPAQSVTDTADQPTFKAVRVTPGQYGEPIADIIAEELQYKQ